MATLIVNGAAMTCTFGLAPSSLIVVPLKVYGSSLPAATIMDFKPMNNIMPFGMCQSLANPQVASATTAAFGVLTPMPCIPNTVTPWTPGATKVKISNMAALSNTSTCNCLWAGLISITSPGQVKVNVT